MKIAIIGSRTFNNYPFLKEILLPHKHKITEIVSGGAKGADSLGERFADEFKIPKKIFLPDWTTNGKAAGLIRNHDIIKNCDKVIAFWDGVSKGTKHALELCSKYNKSYQIFKF